MIVSDIIWHHNMMLYDSIWYHMISYETAIAFGCHSSVHSGWETLSFLVQYMISSTWCDAMQIVDWLCGWTMTMTWLYLARGPDITNPQNPLSSIRMCSYNLWFFLSECQVHQANIGTQATKPSCKAFPPKSLALSCTCLTNARRHALQQALNIGQDFAIQLSANAKV